MAGSAYDGDDDVSGTGGLSLEMLGFCCCGCVGEVHMGYCVAFAGSTDGVEEETTDGAG